MKIHLSVQPRKYVTVKSEKKWRTKAMTDGNEKHASKNGQLQRDVRSFVKAICVFVKRGS